MVASANSRITEYEVKLLPLLANDTNPPMRHDTRLMAANKARVLEQAKPQRASYGKRAASNYIMAY
jgi:hypothetical protein